MNDVAEAKLAEEIAIKRCLLVGRVWRDYYDFTNSVHEARTIERLHELERILDSRDANTLSQPAAQAVPEGWRKVLKGLVYDIEGVIRESDRMSGLGEILPAVQFAYMPYLSLARDLLATTPTPPAGGCSRERDI